MKNNTSNFNQALWLGLGQLCTFALSFISAAILARHFDKTEYGTYKQILYVYNTLFTLFTVGLPNVFAYYIPRLNNGQQKSLVSKLNKLFLLLGAFFSVGLFICADLIANLLNNPDLANGIRIFSPFPLFTLPAMGVEGIYTALRRTKLLAIYQILSRLLMLICIIVPVIYFGGGYREAVMGWGLASFLIFILAMYMKSQPYFHVKKEVVENFYRQVFDYCLPLVGAFVAGFFISSADQFYISRYFGTKTFAEASNGCMSIPIAGMISSSVRSVLLPLFSSADAQGSICDALLTYNRAVRKCITLVFPILLFCIFYASEIMLFIYGEQYATSGTYLQIFIIRDFMGCLPYFSVLMALGCTKFYMNIHIVGVVYIWLTDYIIAQLGFPPTLFVAVSSSFQVGSALFAFMYIKHKTGIQLLNKSINRDVIKVLLHNVAILIIVYSFSLTLFNNLPVIITIVSSGFVYYTLLFLTSRIVNLDYFESFRILLQK